MRRVRALGACVALLAATVPLTAEGAAAADLPVVVAGLSAPAGLAVAGSTVYVSDGDRVVRSAGGPATTVVSGLAAPHGIAVEPGGALLVAESGADRIVRVDGGAPVPVAGGFDQPTGLALGGDGALYVADTLHSRVAVVRDGVVGTLAGNGGAGYGGDWGPAPAATFAFPSAVAVDRDGLVVADTLNNRVRRVAGGIVATLAGGGAGGSCAGEAGPGISAALAPPSGVAADGTGNVFVAEGGAGRVVRISPDGSLTTIAAQGQGLQFPGPLALAGGDLLVADVLAGRVVRIADAATAPAVTAARAAGADRYATAAALSASVFAAGAPAAFVATGEAFADALGASGAAGAAGGPVLLTRRASLPDETARELRRLRPGRVVVVGGPAAVADAVVDAVRAIVPDTARVAGPDRFATAAALASSFPAGGDVYVVSGLAFPDALSGGAAAARAGAPMLLVAPNEVPPATADALGRLAPDRITVVGGAAAVDDGVVQALAPFAGSGVERLAGADRYDTAARVAAAHASASRVLVATGLAFPDGLAAAAAAPAAGGPVLLVPCFAAPPAARDQRERFAGAPLLVVGGRGAVPDLAVADLEGDA